MSRPAAAICSALCVLGAALLVGGKGGLVGGTVALALLAAGAVIGIPALITSAAGAVAMTFVASLVLQRSPLDLTAPLIGVLLLAGLELGHLSLEGSRYTLPDGRFALAVRASLTAVIAVLGFGLGWLLLLGAFSLPAGASVSVVFGVAAVLAIFGLLIFLGRESSGGTRMSDPGL